MTQAAKTLETGGSALDAVEAGISPVESNTLDDSVGLGGLPNVLGHVELDASIMDGRTLSAGAVGALQGYEHPISIARLVMERSPHVFLVGDGARRFAQEMGSDARDLHTPQSTQAWRQGLNQFLPEPEIDRIGEREQLLPLVNDLQEMVRQHGTVNFLALDSRGDIASGVSTSGWPWKYPGRLGDSPVIGAGNYADNRYGAAACCGYGELAIRAGTARSVVLYMQMGLSVEDACRKAMQDLEPLLATQGGDMGIHAMDRRGHAFGITTIAQAPGYWVVTNQTRAAQECEYAHFALRRP
jgi:beta-aspartyl-peptidase (threonine type)